MFASTNRVSRTARFVGALAAIVVVAAFVSTETAHAQNHYPRQHAVQPLGELLPASLPAPMIGHPGAKKKEKPKRIRDRKGGGFTYRHPGFNAKVGADGRVKFNDINIRGSFFLVPPFVFIAGVMDITDVVMRWMGVDPYQYAKARFLERTFAERMRMRRRYDAINMQRALNGLPAYLAAVWRQPWSAELRRRVLFVLWDECAEAGNESMREGGAKARQLIDRFVALKLPPGSPNGYTVAELRALNARRTSMASFKPYADLPQRTMMARHVSAPRALKLPMSSALMRLANSF